MSDDAKKEVSTAADRLAQVSSHINAPAVDAAPKKRRQKKPKNEDDELPADYSDILGQIKTLQTMAATPDPTLSGYSRQKAAGKLWVRERVTKLFDPGSFVEVGSVSGTVQWKLKEGSKLREEPVSYVPSNNVQGFGKLRGRKVVFTADDFSIRAGHADGALMDKTVYMEKLALALKLPMIKLVDGSSGGGSVTSIRTNGWSYVPPLGVWAEVVKQLEAGIPNLGAALGPAVGLGAARVVACHFSVMAGDIGALFNAGPKVVAGATFEEGLGFRDLGGPEMHCTNGTIDNLAPDEEGCFEQIRTVLSFLPNHGLQAPPTVPGTDPVDRPCENLRTIIPRKIARSYNPRAIIETCVDAGSWFEIGALWGTTAIVGLARFDGRPTGIVSLNCEVNAGALDAAGAQKISKHLKLLDMFNIPLVQFVDVPGYAIGTVAERTATMRHGVNLGTAYYATTMPIFSVITRRVYGIAGALLLDSRDPRMRVAWPSGEWGSLPLDGGIEVGHAAELKRAAKEGKFEERYKELETEYKRLMNPVRTANNFGVEEIIDPAVTRQICCAFVKHVYEELMPIRLMERSTGKIRPIFT